MKGTGLKLLGIAILVISIAGCGGFATKMNRLSVGLNKDEVRALFGNNFTAKLTFRANGRCLDLWSIMR